jgi:hypothetical protein
LATIQRTCQVYTLTLALENRKLMKALKKTAVQSKTNSGGVREKYRKILALPHYR